MLRFVTGVTLLAGEQGTGKSTRLLQRAAEDGHQVIAAVHNPIVIASQPRVLSLDTGEWMASERFIALASDLTA